MHSPVVFAVVISCLHAMLQFETHFDCGHFAASNGNGAAADIQGFICFLLAARFAINLNLCQFHTQFDDSFIIFSRSRRANQ